MLQKCSEGGLTELNPLVGEEESGESTSLVSGDRAGLHDIEVAPSLVEVSVKVAAEGITERPAWVPRTSVASARAELKLSFP